MNHPADRFNNVPVEADTRIQLSLAMKLDTFDVLYQRWSWDGIAGSSVIFVADDVAALSNGDLIDRLRSTGVMRKPESPTIQRGQSGYTFVNFDFDD